MTLLPRRLAACLLLSAAALVGCERPLVDPLDRRVEVVGVDLGEVQTSPDLQLGVRVPGATAVTIDGDAATASGSDGTFQARVALRRGLNRLVVQASDSSGPLATDTLEAVYLPLMLDPAAAFALPSPRAEAAVVATGSRVLVTGGAGNDGAALASMAVLTPSGRGYAGTDVALLAARAGHTASLLPDGSVLLLGGATVAEPRRPTEFVASAEIVRPGSAVSEFVSLPSGTVVRAGHTARVLQTGGRTLVYLYGGLVPTGTAVALSGTIDAFEWTGTDLRRLTPEGGAGSFEPLAGHVQIPLTDGASRAVDFVGGSAVAFQFVFTAPGTNLPFNVAARDAEALATPRTDAAGAPLGVGALGLIVGGRGAGGTVVGTAEVVAEAPRRAFSVADRLRLSVPRAGAGATLLPGSRILVAGGRTPAGTASAAAEVFSFE